MAYTALTTVENIQAYFKNTTFGASTTPTSDQVSEWIDRATAIIYSNLDKQYSIPITDTDDLLQLKELADMYVVVKVRNIGGLGLREIKDGKVYNLAESHAEFFKRLKMYVDGVLTLPNSAATSSKLLVYDYNSNNDVEAVSSKSDVMW